MGLLVSAMDIAGQRTVDRHVDGRHLDTQDGRGCACALGRGSPHRCLLTHHNLMGDAGINDESETKQKNVFVYTPI